MSGELESSERNAESQRKTVGPTITMTSRIRVTDIDFEKTFAEEEFKTSIGRWYRSYRRSADE